MLVNPVDTVEENVTMETSVASLAGNRKEGEDEGTSHLPLQTNN